MCVTGSLNIIHHYFHAPHACAGALADRMKMRSVILHRGSACDYINE